MDSDMSGTFPMRYCELSLQATASADVAVARGGVNQWSITPRRELVWVCVVCVYCGRARHCSSLRIVCSIQPCRGKTSTLTSIISPSFLPLISTGAQTPREAPGSTRGVTPARLLRTLYVFCAMLALIIYTFLLLLLLLLLLSVSPPESPERACFHFASGRT